MNTRKWEKVATTGESALPLIFLQTCSYWGKIQKEELDGYEQLYSQASCNAAADLHGTDHAAGDRIGQ